MKIIDFHTHPYRKNEQNLHMYKELGELSPARQRQQLEDAGICRICGSVIERAGEGDGFEKVRTCNREALEIARELKGFYLPGIHVHPAWVKESCQEIEWAHENGIRLIGELVPYLQGWNGYQDSGLSEILDCAAQYHMVVSFHSSATECPEEMVKQHPGLTFVAAHPGERAQVEQHIERMRKFPNLYLDLSGTGMFRFGMLQYLVREAGAERIVFGTDYPICNPRMYVQAVYGENLSEEERKLIFAENAERLLGTFPTVS